MNAFSKLKRLFWNTTFMVPLNVVCIFMNIIVASLAYGQEEYGFVVGAIVSACFCLYSAVWWIGKSEDSI